MEIITLWLYLVYLGIKINVIEGGDVFAWGKCKYGQLGFGSEVDMCEPRRINKLVDLDIVQISCGFEFSMALTRDGEVYSWGTNVHGQVFCSY